MLKTSASETAKFVRQLFACLFASGVVCNYVRRGQGHGEVHGLTDVPWSWSLAHLNHRHLQLPRPFHPPDKQAHPHLHQHNRRRDLFKKIAVVVPVEAEILKDISIPDSAPLTDLSPNQAEKKNSFDWRNFYCVPK